jgi:prevent-host-death family protein
LIDLIQALFMRTIDIREAKGHLSRLVDEAAAGDPFVISKRGRPLVKVFGVEAQQAAGMRRIGLMKDHLSVPHDFARVDSGEIKALFQGHRRAVRSTKR